MPGLSSEKVENTAITGPELMEFILFRLREAMRQDWVFNKGTAYPRVAFEAEVRLQFVNPNMRPMTIVARNQGDSSVESPLPLKDAYDTGVHAFSIGDKIENPNAARIHAEIPITIVSSTPATKDHPVPRVESHQVTYSKDSAPEIPPPAITDLSEQVAAKHGVKPAVPTDVPPRRKAAVKYDSKDKEDLDAVGVEEE